MQSVIDKFKWLLLLGCVAVMTTGCLDMSPSIEATSQKQAQEMTDSFVYTKSAKTGLCFGTTTTSRMNTGGRRGLQQHRSQRAV